MPLTRPFDAVQGKDAISFLEGLVVGDIAALQNGTGSLSLLTNETGGVIDDSVITKVGCFPDRSIGIMVNL